MTLSADHVAWDIETYYLAQALTAYIYSLSPERIVLGGGVMHRSGLLSKVRNAVRSMLGGYVRPDLVERSIDTLIVPPTLGDQAGILGAMALAMGGRVDGGGGCGVKEGSSCT